MPCNFHFLELGNPEYVTHTIHRKNRVLYLTTELDCFLAIKIWILEVNTISKSLISMFMKRETFGLRNIFSPFKYLLVITKCSVFLWRWNTRYCSTIYTAGSGQREPPRLVLEVGHASLKLTKIVFPTRASCHRTLLMCSSDKFSKLNQ